MASGKLDWDEHYAMFIAGRWFEPVIKDIEAFEEFSKELYPDTHKILADPSTPEWVLNCLRSAANVDRGGNGFGSLVGFGPRRLGEMVGMKWWLYDVWARGKRLWPLFNDALTKKFEEHWGEGFVAGMIEFSELAASTYTPRMREIMERATSLATDQGPAVLSEYCHGINAGLEFWQRTLKRAKAPKGKRERDLNARMSVLFAAMCHAPEIEANRGHLTIPKLTDTFSEAFNNVIPFDADTVKKNLQGVGLKGIGKRGRPRLENREDE